jgi:hypothetical protein
MLLPSWRATEAAIPRRKAAMGASLLLRLTGLAAVALLGACAADRDPVMSDPSFYQKLTTVDAKVDARMAASMISGYRANNGLTAVTVDPTLMQMAEEQARAMAARDKLDHSVSREFNDRLRAKGYNASAAAENISAGYHTLAEAFSGWRDSPPHRKNMLLNGATKMGIAAVQAPKSKFKVYWGLIIAAPDGRRGETATPILIGGSGTAVLRPSFVCLGARCSACPGAAQRHKCDRARSTRQGESAADPGLRSPDCKLVCVRHDPGSAVQHSVLHILSNGSRDRPSADPTLTSVYRLRAFRLFFGFSSRDAAG